MNRRVELGLEKNRSSGLRKALKIFVKKETEKRAKLGIIEK